MEETAQYYKKRFYLQILDLQLPFQNFMPHIEIWNFVKITGPYCRVATETRGFYLYFFAFKKFEPVKYTI